MMKNQEYLPIIGIVPLLVAELALTAAILIAIFLYIFRIGTLSGLPVLLMCIIGNRPYDKWNKWLKDNIIIA